MTLRQYLILMTIASSICWLVWGCVVWRLDPNSADALGFAFFYLSFGLAIMGTISVLGFWIRQLLFHDNELVFRHVRQTFRQSIIIALGCLSLLFLIQLRVLRWWNAILLLLIFLTIEGIVFANRRYTGK